MAAEFFAVYSLVSLLIKVVVTVLWMLWRIRLYWLSIRMPGPISWPFVGNIPSLLFKKGSFFEKTNAIIAENRDVFAFWIGIQLFVVCRDLEQAEKILSCSDSCKDDPNSFPVGYHFGHKKNDERWRTHKKTIKPLMNIKFLIDNTVVFQKHVDELMKILEKRAGKEVFDIYKDVNLCFVDIFGEIILGKNVEAQSGKNAEFIGASESISKHSNKKSMYECLHHSLFYRCTKSYRETSKARDTLNYFVEDAIRKSWERRKMDVFGENSTGGSSKLIPVIDEIGSFIEMNPDEMKNKEFRNYLKTLFLTSEKTMSCLLSICCLCFALNPEDQNKAAEEVCSIVNAEKTVIKYDELQKMKYLDACVQEVLRMFPTRPFIVRNFTKDYKIENWTIPSQCTIVVPLHVMNRNPENYENPNDFKPERFLPENVRNRNGKEFVFGAGPRECVAKLLAMMCVKLVMANILRKYNIEADGNLSELQLTADPFTRLTNGCFIRLRPKT